MIGIGGVGMVWIADYALAQGWAVSGTDLVESHAITRLKSLGATIHIGSNPSEIPENITEVIITSAITESSSHYPELLEIEKRKIPVLKRAQWVGKLTKKKYTIAVAGTHGKTTTTAMIGWILDQAGLDPTVFVGSSIAKWNNATKIGSSEYLVLEADEFDRSFHNFYPQIAVLLNIDKDHTDYYTGGITEIERAFRRFLRNLPSGVHTQSRGKGMVIGYGRDGRVRKIAKGFKLKFRWYDETKLWPGLKLPQPGLVYKLNATAAARVAHELGVPHETIVKALASFPGTSRRFEHLGTWHGAQIYDDYAHHPTEISATLQAIREKWLMGSKKVALIFQPHQKARTQQLLQEFAHCFSKNPPDYLVIAPIYQVAGREEDIPITNFSLAEAISATKPNFDVAAVEGDQLSERIQQISEQVDIVILMGAGSIRTIFDEIRK